MRMAAALATFAILLGTSAVAQDAVIDAEGYRSARYRAPVTVDPRPASRIALPAAIELAQQGGALFIDVMPAEGGVRDPATGRWRLSIEHETIPGAAWHPEAGRSPVDPALWHGLEQAVAIARKRHPARPVVVFCRADCWMSWNAARRLASRGVSGVWWLSEGTDGWHAAELRLVPARPVSIPRQQP